MASSSHNTELNDGQLRNAVTLIAVFVSDSILDPHCGFEGQFAGAARIAVSREELVELLRRTLDALDSMGFSPELWSRLEQQLETAGLPDTASLRTFCEDSSPDGT